MTTCPDCKVNTIKLSSMNKTVCPACKKTYEWFLKDGQKSLLIRNLTGEAKS